jgi:multidrug efflux pump subunit AcrA (membrane-fusion protein)
MSRPWKAVLFVVLASGVVAGALFTPRLYTRLITPDASAVTPSTKVRRGNVTFTINANGALQGGNSKMVTAPMIGSQTLVITELAQSGELVKEGEVVLRFDSTDETFKLREAEADVQETEQQVVQAEAEAAAKEEELNYALIKARGDLRDAELEARRNPLLAEIVARQNDLALQGARDLLAKLESDYPTSKATAKASIAIQTAARDKAKMQADTARRNIDMMNVKAPAGGYINVERNTNQNMMWSGMTLPLFQIGDQARPGMAVAQIPDMAHWEVSAQIAESDRGHLSIGQPAEIRVVALPGKLFHGRIKDLGGTAGSPWDRHFECKLSLEDSAPELRPGMSTRIVVTMETIKNALWLPAQALFESDSRTFVYVKSGRGFTAHDVKLVRRSESKVVLTGVKEGDEVSLASPDETSDSGKKSDSGSATKAVGK